ncbi:MAG: hypothetical protein JWR69_30 [Pedosphaera sp.]|nr:hypothetical protein [Pedosphaera sp.]
MSPPLRRIFWLLLGLGASVSLVTSLVARDSAPPPAMRPAIATAAQAPLLPLLKSPIDAFRELLAMKSAERERFLANRPPELRKRIMDKVNEYEALTPDDRTLRLRMTELRWYLLRFTQTPATNRTAQLATVPAADRQLVEDHLQQWDRLSPVQQKEVLDYEATMQVITQTNAPGPSTTLSNLPDQERTMLIHKIGDWNKLPDEQRQQMYDRFHQFFELTEAEKQKTLHVLSAAERLQMERALKTFERLPEERRERCLGAFRRFAGMSEEEREQFLVNAERWQEMSPADREAWRGLVSHLPQPPMPPGFGGPPLPSRPGSMVPMPKRSAPVPLATNSTP